MTFQFVEIFAGQFSGPSVEFLTHLNTTIFNFWCNLNIFKKALSDNLKSICWPGLGTKPKITHFIFISKQLRKPWVQCCLTQCTEQQILVRNKKPNENTHYFAILFLLEHAKFECLTTLWLTKRFPLLPLPFQKLVLISIFHKLSLLPSLPAS